MKNPIPIRFVKVTTTGNETPEEIMTRIAQNAQTGATPIWEELWDTDTPELDTETIFPVENPTESTIQLAWHQITIPLPMDKFGSVLSKMTAMQFGKYCQAICIRENWTMDYNHILIVLNNLDMEMAY